MTLRDEFLSSLEEADPKKFVAYVNRNVAKDDPFDFQEIIQSLPSKKHKDLWQNILLICGTVLSEVDMADDLMDSPFQTQMSEILEVLGGIATFANCAISVKDPVLPEQLFQVALILHGILLSLPEDAGKVQNGISQLCESWYAQDHNGKENLITNTLPYLLAKTHTTGAIENDIKRVWRIHEGFLALDFEDESSESIKHLIVECFCHPVFLKVVEGKKLLSFFFKIHLKFSSEIHKLLKNQIPKLPQQYLEIIGELYFKAWQSSESQLKEVIEESIQDFMFHAIHAQRNGGTNSMSSRLRKILGFIHGKKREPGVAELLFKLYQPILWRAFKVANPYVRMNAISILVDAFPLQDPTGSNTENDEIMQKQFDTFADLLQDPFPAVRAVVIIGVCRVCSLFWEWIPPNTLQDLVTKLVTDMTHDVNSADVRCAVYQGLKHLVENRLSHPSLKSVLPQLKHLIHDTSAKVRAAFLELLLFIKGMRTLKFWNIVPIEELFARLEFESSATCIKKIVKLLLNSYLPVDKTPKDQVISCIKLIHANRAASRKFYQYACTMVPMASIRKFMSFLTIYIHECCQRGLCQDNAETVRNDTEANRDEGFEEEDNGLEENDPAETDVDNETVSGLLDVLAIIISVSQKRSKKEIVVKGKLLEKLTKTIPVFLSSFENSEARASVMVIAREIPKENISAISKSCLHKFKDLPEMTTEEEFGPLLDCLCQWNLERDILSHVNQMFLEFFEQHRQSGANAKKRPRNLKQKPELARRFLTWIQTHSFHSLVDCQEEMSNIQQTLEVSLTCLEEALKKDPITKLSYSDMHCLSECMNQFCKLNIQSVARASDDLVPSTIESKIIDAFETVFTWLEQNILPKLDNARFLSDSEIEVEYKTKGKKKHLISDDETVSRDFSLIFHKIIKDFLSLISDTVLIGYGSRELSEATARWIEKLVGYDFVIPLVPQMLAVCFQIIRDPLTLYDADSQACIPCPGDEPTCLILRHVLQAMSATYRHKVFSNSISQIILASKSTLSEIVRSAHMKTGNEQLSRSLMAILEETCISDITDAVEKTDLQTDFEKEFRYPPLASVILGIIDKSSELKKKFLVDSESRLRSSDGIYTVLASLMAVMEVKRKGLGVSHHSKLTSYVSKVEEILEQMGKDSEEENFNKEKEVGQILCNKLKQHSSK